LVKYIKHLISFLLIFGLTVNECSIYSQINSTNYHQVSYVNTRKEFSQKHSELYVYTGQILFEKVLSIVLITYRNLQDVYSTQIQTILKLRIGLYQKINSMKAQHVFLSKIITSSNHYSSLYIA
jgi:hypothetical protein